MTAAIASLGVTYADTAILGDCNTCGRSFTVVDCCCSFQTDEGETEIEAADGSITRSPFIRHLDAACRDCCQGVHRRDLNGGVGDYTRMGDE